MTVQYFTPEGLKKLQDELNQLRTVERPRISQQIAEARDKGDLSENAEYDAAKDAQDTAAKRAREVIYEARVATREVMRDGETLSGHLHQLSDSLRANAERLLLDIRAAHAEMTARLDRVDPDLGASVGRLDRDPPSPRTAQGEPDVPEFVLRRPR